MYFSSSVLYHNYKFKYLISLSISKDFKSVGNKSFHQNNCQMINMSSMLTASDYVDKLGLFAVFTEITNFLTIIHGWLNITSWTFILC